MAGIEGILAHGKEPRAYLKQADGTRIALDLTREQLQEFHERGLTLTTQRGGGIVVEL